jgi:hypothetical protein
MSKRTNSFIRSSKGTRVLSKSASIIVESMMPYGKKLGEDLKNAKS